MKMKYSYDPANEDQVRMLEELRAMPQVGDQLETYSSWVQASEIEKATWARVAGSVEARVSGAMFDLVEQLLADRAFERTPGAYLAGGAQLDDLVYAAKRLLQGGQKVVLLDWDVTRGAGEELLSSVVPVIDIHQGAAEGGEDLAGEGRAELTVDQGADDLEWTMTVERAGELMRELEGVDVILFLADDTATGEFQLEEDTVSMSASTVGRLAGAWGASVLQAGGSSRIYQVLASQLEMTSQELNR